MAEKQPTPSEPSRPIAKDEALVYLESHHAEATDNESELKYIRRKIDRRVVPWLALCFLVQTLDKFALNYAAVMGLREDLNLTGNDFTNVATAFFVAFILVEVPNVFLLQRLPPVKWLGLNVCLWGIATACTAATRGFGSLLACRILLGIFEATTMPSSQAITSQWYTKAEAAPRYACWALGNGGAQILGSLISFGFQHMEGAALSGWRTMFLILGVLTIGVGVATAYWVPDTPMMAKFLSEKEKVSLLRHVSTNKTGIRNQKFKPKELWEAARDVQIWIFGIATISIACSSGIVTTYSATLIRNMGFTPKASALLNMPSGAVSLLSVPIIGYAVRITPGHQRWFYIALSCLIAAIGAGLMSFLPSSNKAGLLIGIWLINSIIITPYIIYHYVSVNVSGHTKRSLAANLVAICFGLGNIIGPQAFQARDAPQYVPAKIMTLATEVAAAALMGLLVGYYVWENKRRDRVGLGRDMERDEEVWAGLTDRRNGAWRYVY